ncbi:MAG: thermonuclease family protein [Nitrospiraceae bacterium]
MTRWRSSGIVRLAAFVCALWLGTDECRAAGEFHARVYRIIDGDTVELRYDGRMQMARLRGIDAPELKQPYGPQAKRAVAAMVTGMVVRIRPYGTDKGGAVQVDIILQSGRSVSRSLLQEGFAWRRPDAAPDFDLEAAEADAQYSHRGLWSEPNPTAPWVYRASKSHARR